MIFFLIFLHTVLYLMVKFKYYVQFSVTFPLITQVNCLECLTIPMFPKMQVYFYSFIIVLLPSDLLTVKVSSVGAFLTVSLQSRKGVPKTPKHLDPRAPGPPVDMIIFL